MAKGRQTLKTDNAPAVISQEQVSINMAPGLLEMFPQYAAIIDLPITHPIYSTEWKPGSKGSYLLYITARTACDLMNAAFGGAWSSEESVMDSTKGTIFKCTLTLLHPVTMQQLGWQRTGVADPTDIEAIKGGASDSMKRAMVSIFPAISALYNGPKVEWDGAAKQPDVADVIDTLEFIMALFVAGDIRDKRKVYVKQDDASKRYYVRYFSYAENKYVSKYAPVAATIQEKEFVTDKPVIDITDKQKPDATTAPASDYDNAKAKLLGNTIKVSAAGKEYTGKCVEYSADLKDKLIEYVKGDGNRKFFIKTKVLCFCMVGDDVAMMPVDSPDVEFYTTKWKFAVITDGKVSLG